MSSRKRSARCASLSSQRPRFLEPANTEDDLIAEGLINRVLRVAEEAGRIGDDTANRRDEKCGTFLLARARNAG